MEKKIKRLGENTLMEMKEWVFRPWIDLLSLFRFALKYVTTATVNRTTPDIMTVMAIPRTTIVPTEQNKHMTAIAILHIRITIEHAEQNQHRSLDRDATSLNTFTFKHAQMKKILRQREGRGVFSIALSNIQWNPF